MSETYTASAFHPKSYQQGIACVDPSMQQPSSVCYQCASPVPRGWSYCMHCSEAFSASYAGAYNHASYHPQSASQEGVRETCWIDHSPSGRSNSCGNAFPASSSDHHSPSHYISTYAPAPAGFSDSTQNVALPTAPYVLTSRPHREGFCRCCDTRIEQSRAANQDTCSKRCEWVSGGCCPQCGRQCPAVGGASPALGQPYCSSGCASQSHQANWCATCGVRQMLMGSTHCSQACASRASMNFPIRQRKKVAQQNSFLRHEVMPDKERQMLLQPLRAVFADMGLVVVNIIKCAPHTVRRKNYLTYRSRVEQEMNAQQGHASTKYGFGGEGNEQRRYMPLSLMCTLGAAGNAFAAPGSVAECCEDTKCSACVSLRQGISKEWLGVASHYCTADLDLTLLHAIAQGRPPNTAGLRAVGVCRAVIGSPSFVCDPSQIVPEVDRTHSTIITNASKDKKHAAPRHEGTYLFRDEAVDLQYVVLVQ